MENITFTQEEEKIIAKIERVRQSILQAIPIDTFIDKMKEIINKSDCLDFSSSYTSKFISKEKPIFIVKFDRNKIKQKYNCEIKTPVNSKVESYIKADSDILVDVVQKEVTSHFSEFISSFITGESFKEMMKKDFNIDLDELDKSLKGVDLKNFVTGSIFSVVMNIPTNIVYIQYLFKK